MILNRESPVDSPSLGFCCSRRRVLALAVPVTFLLGSCWWAGLLPTARGAAHGTGWHSMASSGTANVQLWAHLPAVALVKNKAQDFFPRWHAMGWEKNLQLSSAEMVKPQKAVEIWQGWEHSLLEKKEPQSFRVVASPPREEILGDCYAIMVKKMFP